MALISLLRPTQPSWSWSRMALMAVAALLPLLLPSVAAAAGPFTPPADDLSKKIFIDYLFGPLTDSGRASFLTPLMLAFNSSVLILGGIFLAYTLIAGTLSTAHDGEMLGRKWSSVWVPLRTVLGAASLMPVIGSGWCAAQAVVVWLALQGVGLADGLWNKALEGIQSADMVAGFYNVPGMDRPVRNTVSSMFLSHVCVQAYQSSNTGLRAIGGSILGSPDYGVYRFGPVPGVSAGGIIYGTPEEFERAPQTVPVCGMIGLRAIPSGAPATSPGGGDYASSAAQDIVNTPLFDAAILTAHRDAIFAADTTMGAAATSFMQTDNAAAASAAIDAATKAYMASIKTRANAQYNAYMANNNSFINLMKQDGWVMAGAFYMKISKIQDQITQSISAVPAAVIPSDEAAKSDEVRNDPYGPKAFSEGISNLWEGRQITWGTPKEVADTIGKAIGAVNSNRASSERGVAGLDQRFNDRDTDGTSRILAAFLREGSFSDTFTNNLTQNPIIMAKNLGQWMTFWAWSSLAVAAGIGFFAGGAASIAAGPFTLFFSALIVPGAMLSTYLPMLPYILWIGVVLGWAILLIEAVIAAPLWAVVHMAPDADGIVGRGGQGYMLVLSLTLRPALMIFGFVSAIVLMVPIGYLINSTFMGVFGMSVTTGGWGSVTQSIAGCVIYCVVMFGIINRVFGLIHVIPDRILRWIGGGGNELGAEAEGVNQFATAKAVAGVGAMQGMSSSLSNTTAGIGQFRERQRALQASQQGADEQKVGNAVSRMNSADSEATRAMHASRANPSSEFLQGEAASRALDQRDEAEGAAVAQAELSGRTGSSQQRELAQQFMAEHKQASEGGPAAMGAFLQKWNAKGNGPEGRHMPFRGAVRNMAVANSRLAEAESRQTDTGNAASAKNANAWSTSGGGGNTGGDGGPDGTDDGGGAPSGGGGGGSDGGGPSGGSDAGGGSSGGGSAMTPGVQSAVSRPERQGNPLDRSEGQAGASSARSTPGGPMMAPGSSGPGSSESGSSAGGTSGGAGLPSRDPRLSSLKAPDAPSGSPSRESTAGQTPSTPSAGTVEPGDNANRKRFVGKEPPLKLRGDLED